MQQSHDLIHYDGSYADAVAFGERALEIATSLDDEALAYGARFSLGQAAWLGGNFGAAIGFLTANLPENLRNPERVRDFGTAGSLIMDSLSLLGATCAYVGEFERAFVCLDRAVALATNGAFDVSVVQYHVNRAHLQRGDAAVALPLARESVRHATDAGLKFTFPWHLGVLGYALTLIGSTDEAVAVLEKAMQQSDMTHQSSANVRARAFLAEALASQNPERAAEVADVGLNTARKLGYRAQEAELLRIKGAALCMADSTAAKALAHEGLTLARTLGMRPEEGHALSVLADIETGNGDAVASRQNRDRARAIYTGLGMTFWRERVG
jgi:tetratricopeptide (TPR) repeat protein